MPTEPPHRRPRERPKAQAKVLDLFRALSHEARLAVVLLLDEHGPMCVGDLQRALGMEQTALSHQLRILHDARLVSRTRRGRHVEYCLSDRHVAHIVGDAMTHAAEDDD